MNTTYEFSTTAEDMHAMADQDFANVDGWNHETGDDMSEFDGDETPGDEPDDNMTDVEADADTLASAGWGTDEDYGYFGE